jgi:UDP-2,3-diacylglucosamine pyrophosphatase LpxH
MTINLSNYGEGILICGDAHTHTDKLDAIKNRHPDIKERFFLGDLLTFTDSKGNLTKEGNKETCEWLKKNINEWYFAAGNHDHATCREKWKYDIDQETYDLVAGRFQISYELRVGNAKYLLLHSKLKSLWDFINLGYQFRELEDDFPNYEEYKLIIGAHVHKEFVHNFFETDTQLVQIGAVRDNKYAILTEKGIEFKKI